MPSFGKECTHRLNLTQASTESTVELTNGQSEGPRIPSVVICNTRYIRVQVQHQATLVQRQPTPASANTRFSGGNTCHNCRSGNHAVSDHETRPQRGRVSLGARLTPSHLLAP